MTQSKRCCPGSAALVWKIAYVGPGSTADFLTGHGARPGLLFTATPRVFPPERARGGHVAAADLDETVRAGRVKCHTSRQSET